MKLKAMAGVIFFFLSGSAMAINDQSIRSENTFGLIEDEFDLSFYPGFLADFDGYRVYTNLHNTSGANRFQVGWFGLPKSIPGKVFFMFDMGIEKESGEVLLPEEGFPLNWPNFLDTGTFVGTEKFGFFNRTETDFFDDDNDYKSDRRIIRNVSGESWTKRDQYGFLLGYGVSLTKRLNLGVGFVLSLLKGESRDPRSTFDISYIERDLNTNTDLENYSDRGRAKIDLGDSGIGFIIGTKFDLKEKTKIALDFSYAKLNFSGMGKYGENVREANWIKGSFTRTLNETVSGPVGDPIYGTPYDDALPQDGSSINFRLKTYIPAGDKNTIRIDGIFEKTFLEVSDGRKETRTLTTQIDRVSNERMDIDGIEVINYSGDYLSGYALSLLLADIIDATKFLKIGFGFGYEFVKRNIDVRREYRLNRAQRIDRNNDGDAINAPLDYDPITGIFDGRTTWASEMTQGYNFGIYTHYFKIPVAAEVYLTKRLTLRLGVSHFIIVNKNNEEVSLVSGSEQVKEIYEDGMGTRQVFYTDLTVPDNRKSSRVDIFRITDYRVGLGIDAGKNIFIDIIGDYWDNEDYDEHLHATYNEPHEASRIWSIFGSATIKF